MGSEYRQTSRPGSRLPHAWLEQAGQMVSTHDLIPMGGLLVLSDAEGGGAWSSAADTLSSELGVRLANVRVGPDGDAQDLDGTWATVREVDSDGVVVVRPDGHVGYRSVSHAGDPLAALRHAANVILGRTIT